MDQVELGKGVVSDQAPREPVALMEAKRTVEVVVLSSSPPNTYTKPLFTTAGMLRVALGSAVVFVQFVSGGRATVSPVMIVAALDKTCSNPPNVNVLVA